VLNAIYFDSRQCFILRLVSVTTTYLFHYHRISYLDISYYSQFKKKASSSTDIPAADEINTKINYSQEDKHISASLTFQNIYPLPQCMLSVMVC
jgi:hypothetical protein